MGILKKIKIQLQHRKKYFLIKQYSFYKKDFFGLLKYKRFYKYKIVLYNMLRKKKNFYYKILYQIYNGFKFFDKHYSYKSNLLMQKKCLKYFYGCFYDKYIGKLGRLIKNKNGFSLNNFFGLLEKRLDVLLYRAYYAITIRNSYLFILRKIVFVNTKLQYKPFFYIHLGDLIMVSHKPINYFFFLYTNLNKMLNQQKNYFIQLLNLLVIINYTYLIILKKLQLFKPTKNIKDKVAFGFYINLISFQKQLLKFCLFYAILQKIVYKRKQNYVRKIVKFQKNEYFYAIFKFIEIVKYCILKQKKQYLIYTNVKFLYGQRNLKKRFNFLFFFLAPSYKRRYLFRQKAFFLLLKKRRKFFRFQHFSKESFNYLLGLNKFSLLYKGFPSYMEVNYKIHILIIQCNPILYAIQFPFGILKPSLYLYFKRKGYF